VRYDGGAGGHAASPSRDIVATPSVVTMSAAVLQQVRRRSTRTRSPTRVAPPHEAGRLARSPWVLAAAFGAVAFARA